TFRWNHIFSDKLFANLSLIYSNYDYELGTKAVTKGGDAFNWKSKIVNYSIKPDFKYYISPKNTITFGGQALLYDFRPGKATVTVDNRSNVIGLDSKYALESGIYAGNEQTVTSKFSLEYGLRLSGFRYMGKGRAYTYGDTTLKERKPLKSIEEYESFENIKTYYNLEPRLSAKLELTNSSSLKASYNRMAQYLHLLSNTAASVPLDVWTPSSNNIKPQLADQVALGYFKNFGANNDYETSVEVYYKRLQNQIDYIDHADLLLNEFLEGDLLTGKGRAYGLELYVKKNKGKLTGWISYTLARSERQVNGISRNNWYPSRFDRLHNLNTVAMYDLTPRWSVSANFTLGTGTPVTFFTNKYYYKDLPGFHNPEEKRNNFRIPPYHRLDLSATLKGKVEVAKRFNWDLVFSVYNVYNRRNPFAIYLRPGVDNPAITEAVRFSVFGSIVPAVTFNFRF
ncbi:MAG TPA: TonB-dependent receptor, partial [Cytophagaceae bacterium]